MIIYTSDNGIPFPNGRTNLYEPGKYYVDIKHVTWLYRRTKAHLLTYSDICDICLISGVSVPLLIHSPLHSKRWGQITNAAVSLLDIVPTILDWFNVTYPTYHILRPNRPTLILGQSLLPILDQGKDDRNCYQENDTICTDCTCRSFRLESAHFCQSHKPWNNHELSDAKRSKWSI